ncbi:cerebellar degeneration-related protein 2 isoform X2 [Cephus cinctus]|uniref:Cerebellar degeneration-related protein 2 isoform X2 n=1 Tax=Cephus cinctus TaxID=211228 RepID=A0AAJ7FJY6_CEPCN|nr:cerebellar degeneration-related protein 2 isoform X2 [Cephus cinctus]
MSLITSTIGTGVRCLVDEEADHNMLQDLQLAAELGKTLLERNKELENNVKHHQSTIEEQAQEIEYMKKQTAALREVNDSRLKIYEQLEVSIQDLERANHRLALENSGDKKLIKSQCLTIENLEARCEDLQKKFDELTVRYEAFLRQHNSSQSRNTAQSQTTDVWKGSAPQDGSIKKEAASCPVSPSSTSTVDSNVRELASTLAKDEEVTDLLRQLQDAKGQRAREQKRAAELREQLTSLVQENNSLEEQLNAWRNKAQDMKNLQEEINALEEVRQGHLCGRCLRSVDTRTHDELSVMLDHEEDDDISTAESFVNDSHRETESLIQDTSLKTNGENEADDNPYRVLVEKYEALLEVQRHPTSRPKTSVPTPCMSLQEELEMSGEFNFHSVQSEAGSHHENGKINNGTGARRGKPGQGKKPFSATPTDFSEAETSSSGFSDETSNKATQTDGRPGSFLCSIADGEDCKFSIYDDASPIESRFRKTPEYRQLFREIFIVLKRAAEAKDEGEKLPLLDDSTNSVPRVPPVTPAQEEAPSEITTDDNQSVMSSIVSSIVSEPPYRACTPVFDQKKEDDIVKKENISIRDKSTESNTPRIPAGPRRQQLEYLSVNVNVRKKSSAKKNPARKLTYNDRPITPDIVPTTNPRMMHGKSNSAGKRKFRPLTNAEQLETNGVWNGNTIHYYSSKTRDSPVSSRKQSGTGYNRQISEQHNSSYEYKPSAASEGVARLKRLDMSYAEVLRMSNKPKSTSRRN